MDLSLRVSIPAFFEIAAHGLPAGTALFAAADAFTATLAAVLARLASAAFTLVMRPRLFRTLVRMLGELGIARP
jgi:hypothetical protein